MIKGLLFDKDGTLVENTGQWVYELERVLGDMTQGDAALIKSICHDIGLDPVQHRAVPFTLLAQGSFEEIADRLHTFVPTLTAQEIYSLMVNTEEEGERVAAPLPNTLTSIRTLHDQGYKMGVFSNDCERGVHHTMANIQLSDCFSFIAGADSGYGAKPSAKFPDAFCQVCGLSVEEIAIIGDSPADMISADSSGVSVKIGINPDPKNPILLHYTQHILPDLGSLPALLHRLNANRQ